MGEIMRFRISTHDNGYYCVSIPNYEAGEVVAAEDYDALAADTEQLVRLREALQEIADKDTLCNCEHGTKWCCVKMKEYCAFCIADTALRNALGAQEGESK